MERVDVALVAPASRSDNHYRPPLGLMYVAGYYLSKGLTVKIVDVPMKNVVRNKDFWQNRDKVIKGIEDEMIRQVGEIQPKLIGVSCYSPEFEEVKSMINRIKKITDAKVIVGGIHPTLYGEDFEGLADYCYKGRLDNGFPEYALVDMDYYLNANPYAIRGVFLRCGYILASFGCPSQCTFCVAPRLKEPFGGLQVKTPEALYKEIMLLKDKYAIDAFYFIDDLYTIDKDKVREFCKLIKPTGLLWGCNSKVSTLNEEVIKAMSEANCIQIDFGVERGSNEALQKVKKGITIEQVKEVFAACRHYGIRTLANFLVGLPEETDTDRGDIERLIKEIHPTLVSINRFTPYQGTAIYDGGYRTIDSDPALDRWILHGNRRWNSIWRNLNFHLSWIYLKTIFRSKRKMNYLKQLGTLIKEAINQRWS